MKWLAKYLIALILTLNLTQGTAENMLMRRSELSFQETLDHLRKSLEGYGYEFAHVQRCDGGLQGMGYETDLYRTVFFGKLEEIRDLTEKYPELIPYLPLKIAVVQEQSDTILFALNPAELTTLFKQPELAVQFKRWESDMRGIFAELQQMFMETEQTLPGTKSQSFQFQ